MPLTIQFKSRGRSGRIWKVIFALSSAEANQLAALQYAWANNASIIP